MKSNLAPGQLDANKPAQRSRLPLFALFAGNAISFVGDYLTLLAVPWFVLQTTGSVTKTGIAAFFTTLPTVISAFFGSTIVDRLGYKRTSVLGDIASGIAVALLPLLYHTIGLAFWQLLALVFLGGLLKAPGATARFALLPDLTALAQLRLEQANATSDGIRRIAGFIGAPLAGILIAFIGTSNLLWIDAATFATSALLIGSLVPPSKVSLKTGGVRQYISELVDGLRFVRHTAIILALLLTVMITNLLDAALFDVILPDYVKHFFGNPVVLGTLIAAFGGAAFVGTVIYGAIGHRLPRRQTFAISFVIAGAPRFLVLALLPLLPLLIIVHIIAGLAAAPLNPIILTVEQEQVPPEMRARVGGIGTAGVFMGIPLGVILSGYLVEWLGIRPSLLILGISYLVTTLTLLVNPALRNMYKPASTLDTL